MEDKKYGDVVWTLVILYKTPAKNQSFRERLISIIDTKLAAQEKSEKDRQAAYETLA